MFNKRISVHFEDADKVLNFLAKCLDRIFPPTDGAISPADQKELDKISKQTDDLAKDANKIPGAP